jgi:uncharacterized membrane protein
MADVGYRRNDPVDRGAQRRAPCERTHHQRVVDRITSLLGRAGFIAVLTVLIVGWVSLNCFALALGYRAPDPAPFAWLAGASCTRCGTEFAPA